MPPPVTVVSTGQVFADLTVVSEPWIENSRRRVMCRCICGHEFPVKTNSLLSGNTRGCGCKRRAKLVARNFKHGSNVRGERSPEYTVWTQMRARCSNQKLRSYADYGGRGITVCDRWDNSFESFLEDMGPRPSLGHSIERNDVNGNYEPSNCRWATDAEQANNTRRNRRFTFQGETLTLTEWAKKIGITPGGLHGRLAKMPAEEALSKPPEYRGRHIRRAG